MRSPGGPEWPAPVRPPRIPEAAPVRLTGLDDPGLDGYRDLIQAAVPQDGPGGQGRPGRRRADRMPGLFVAEGSRTIRQLLDTSWPLVSLLLAEGRASARPDLVSDALASGASVYIAEQALIDRLAGYHIHRGALALARRPPDRTVREVAGGAGLVLVIEGVNDLENLGSLFRNAAAFGAGAVVLDPTAADPLYRRSVRVSLGHVLRVPFARAGEWPGCLADLQDLGFRLVALTPSGDVTIGELAPEGRWAVMVGAEGEGLSRPALDAADVRARIPLADGVDSLNVATAAAVALHRVTSA